MNSPIEFRVWTGKEMRYHTWHDVINEDLYNRSHDRKETYDEDQVMQFSSLLDKNGKKIFEEDICKTCWGIIYTVTFCEGVFCQNEDYDMPLFRGIEEVEVIGNIQENPDLLEEK